VLKSEPTPVKKKKAYEGEKWLIGNIRDAININVKKKESIGGT